MKKPSKLMLSRETVAKLQLKTGLKTGGNSVPGYCHTDTSTLSNGCASDRCSALGSCYSGGPRYCI